MKFDMYLKVVLTVISICLLWLCLKDLPLIRTVETFKSEPDLVSFERAPELFQYNPDSGYGLLTFQRAPVPEINGPDSEYIVADVPPGGNQLRTNEKKHESPGAFSVMSFLYGENLAILLCISAVWTWGVGLTPSLLIRFVFLKRPISRWIAFLVTGFFWALHLVGSIALESSSKTHGALCLVAFVSYSILIKKKKEAP